MAIVTQLMKGRFRAHLVVQVLQQFFLRQVVQFDAIQVFNRFWSANHLLVWMQWNQTFVNSLLDEAYWLDIYFSVRSAPFHFYLLKIPRSGKNEPFWRVKYFTRGIFIRFLPRNFERVILHRSREIILSFLNFLLYHWT